MRYIINKVKSCGYHTPAGVYPQYCPPSIFNSVNQAYQEAHDQLTKFHNGCGCQVEVQEYSEVEK